MPKVFTIQPIEGLSELEKFVRHWSAQISTEMPGVFRKAGFRVHAQAFKRAPRDNGTLAQRIIHNAYKDVRGVWTVEVGTNVVDDETGAEYPIFVEFGTASIAEGQVKAIGLKSLVTDQEAVHTWPAKEADAIEQTSSSNDTVVGTSGTRRNALGQFVKGPQEQMPWLRPAWAVTMPWFLAAYEAALSPPVRRR